jgi:hypothetical protein
LVGTLRISGVRRPFEAGARTLAWRRAVRSDSRREAMLRSQDERARFVLVEALAAKKRLFLNVRRKRHVEALFGKNSCDINKRLNPF